MTGSLCSRAGLLSGCYSLCALSSNSQQNLLFAHKAQFQNTKIVRFQNSKLQNRTDKSMGDVMVAMNSSFTLAGVLKALMTECQFMKPAYD